MVATTKRQKISSDFNPSVSLRSTPPLHGRQEFSSRKTISSDFPKGGEKMKYIKWLIASVVVAALLIFTAVFVINAYNTGRIGNKDEKVAGDFVEDIQGVWKNTSTGTIASKVNSVRFGEDGRLTVVVLGQTASGTYSDEYDLDSKKHTLTVKGNIYGGLSIERSFEASLNEDKDTLTLKDTKGSFDFTLVKTDETELTTAKTTQAPKTTVPKTEKSTALSGDAAKYAEALRGKWVSKLSSASGYEFIDDSTVRISLVGFSTDGTYSITANENGKCEIRIYYIGVAGVTVSNTYIADIGETELTLIQKNAESVSVTYVRAQ